MRYEQPELSGKEIAVMAAVLPILTVLALPLLGCLRLMEFVLDKVSVSPVI